MPLGRCARNYGRSFQNYISDFNDETELRLGAVFFLRATVMSGGPYQLANAFPKAISLRARQLVGTGRRRIVVLFVLVFFFLIASLTVHPKTRQIGRDLYYTATPPSASKEATKLGFGPPTYEKLKKWEDDLPQHNLDLPFPEGRTGRYVKFSNQIRMLGWNNVFNEVYATDLASRLQ